MADETLSKELRDIVQQAIHYRQLKKGANEAGLGVDMVGHAVRMRGSAFK